MKLARAFGILCGVLFAANAAAQSYPSRPTFLSAGVGCNPNLFASNVLGQTTNGFICIGGYPNASGGDAQIYFLDSVNQGDSSASIRVYDNEMGGTSLILDANGNRAIEFGSTGMDLFAVIGNPQYSLMELSAVQFQFDGSDSDPNVSLVSFTSWAGGETHAGALRTVANGLTDEFYDFGSYDVAAQTWTETAYRLTFDADTGAFSDISFTPPTVTLAGVTSLILDDGDITDLDGPVIVADDFSATGDATFGDDVAVTDEFSAGTADISGVLTVGSCVGCAAAGAPYGGYSDAAATAENVPTGWSVAVVGFVYTITHNLGLASGLDLAVACSAAQITQELACQTDGHGANSFTISIIADGDTLTNAEFMFTAVVVDN